MRSVIRFLWAKELAPIEIHFGIQAVYGSNVMTVQHVRKWCREISGCRVNVTDEQRSGHPHHVPAAEETVLVNRRLLLEKLGEQHNLSHGTVWDIVHKCLGYREVCRMWDPRQVTEDHEKNPYGCISYTSPPL